MRARTRARSLWFVVGFTSGWLGAWLYGALGLWGFEEQAVFKWLRWAGKETIKFAFIALIFAVILFVIIQLLNYFYFAREIHNDDQKRK
jgi:hypothetical protein